jgi:anthranilate synthase component 1
VSAKVALTRATERLSSVVDSLDAPLDKQAVGGPAGPIAVAAQSNTTPDEFKAMVLRGKDYIFAGDIFQVVLSQRFEAPFELPPFALYRALRRVNPAPFLYFLDFGEFSIAGSSPEILVRVREGSVTIRPLAGTRPRGATPQQDKALETELLADEKERAEHLARHGQGHRTVLHRALQPGDAHCLQCRGPARRKIRRPRCAGGRFPGRHRLGRTQGAGDGDHQRA